MPPLRPLTLTVALASVFASNGWATDAPPVLQMSEALTPVARGYNEIRAERVDGTTGDFLQAEGAVSIRDDQGGQIKTPWLRYSEKDDLATCRGPVQITRPGERISGVDLTLRLTPRLGDLHSVHYWIAGHNKPPLPVQGVAKKLYLEGPEKYRMEEVTYSTCAAGQQDWVLKADEIHIDYTTSLGKARQARVEYMGMPILYSPWLRFSLDNARKSGFLAPTYGASDSNGLEFTLPWYWNIAPNRDATLVPRYLGRRGLQLGGEFRYLEQDYSGKTWADYLPSDSVAKRDRYQFDIQHQQRFSSQLSGSLRYHKVSDNAYFTDLSGLVNQTSQVNLPREASLAYQGNGWNAGLRVQTYQTLADVASAPYEQLPQITASTSQADLYGSRARLDVSGEIVHFDHPASSKITGTRAYAYPSVSLPLQTTYGYLTPKLGLHVSRYQIDNPTPSDGYTDTTRSLPIFSLDSGVYLERDWQLGGRNFLHTLEPRAYYVRIPHTTQTQIPVFDSALQDISLPQLFSENQFSGIDRINDANQLTIGVTNRFINADKGIERLQLTLAQRFYFRDQTVTLPGGSTRATDASDVLATASAPINARLRLSGGLRYSSADHVLAQGNLGGVYDGGPGKRINADYRYTDPRYGALKSLDISFQWPIKPQWYAVGRANYAFVEKRLAEGLIGFEYNPGCWSLRGVIQQLATTTTTANTAFFLQLELRGLTQLGPNPLDVLKRNISGYTKSDDITP
ncbi:MAG: LPS-assembly protein LptD [Betaproteobacteria bacterium]|nr:MAG: LPS-assembly protein LptD [Betaproteobacteria bacterium]